MKILLQLVFMVLVGTAIGMFLAVGVVDLISCI